MCVASLHLHPYNCTPSLWRFAIIDFSLQDPELDRVLACARSDLYGILGCSSDADAGQLKRAYRKLALHLHPDKCAPPQFGMHVRNA